MRRIRLTLLLAALIAGSVTATLADPVSAAPDPADDVFGEPLDVFLSKYPAARPIGNGRYELAPGMVLAPPGQPAGGVGILESPSGCTDNWFCLWEHKDFGGWSTSFFYCNYRDLQPEHQEKVSSMHNAQNNYTAYYYDTDAGISAGLGSNSYLRNLAKNGAPGGGNWNDRIDAVDAC